MGGFAWVTLATNDSYSLGALVLAHSLRRVGTKHDLAVLVTPGVTGAMREKLSSVFSLVQEVNVLDSKDEANLALLARPELGITFTKLHCWRLTQYEKCVFVDADTLVIRNCDELFDREELSAAPDVGWPDCFNSGVFVFKPSQQTFASITTFAAAKGSFDGGDQGLLNQYFSDWAHKDIAKHLPFIYNMCSTATYSYLPAFKQFGDDVRIIHFIGITKPWLQYFDTLTGQVQPAPGSNHLQPLLQLWWNIFCENVHPQLSPVMASSTLAQHWHEHKSNSSLSANPRAPLLHDCNDTTYESIEPDFSEFQDPWERHSEQSYFPAFDNNDPCNIDDYNNGNDNNDNRASIDEKYFKLSVSLRFANNDRLNSQNHSSDRNCCHDDRNAPSVLENICSNERQDNWEIFHDGDIDGRYINVAKDRSRVCRDNEDCQTNNTFTDNWKSFRESDGEHDRNDDERDEFTKIDKRHYDRLFEINHRRINENFHRDDENRGIYHHERCDVVEDQLENEKIHGDDVLTTILQRVIAKNEIIRNNEEDRLQDRDINDFSEEQTDASYTMSHSHPVPCTKSKSITAQCESNITRELESNDAGIAGALAKITLGEARSPEQVAFEEHMRKQSWEQGQIDYMGRDSFDNIWKKISETLAVQTERQPSPPKSVPMPEKSELEEATAVYVEDETAAKSVAAVPSEPQQKDEDLYVELAQDVGKLIPALPTGQIIEETVPSQLPLIDAALTTAALVSTIPHLSTSDCRELSSKNDERASINAATTITTESSITESREIREQTEKPDNPVISGDNSTLEKFDEYRKEDTKIEGIGLSEIASGEILLESHVPIQVAESVLEADLKESLTENLRPVTEEAVSLISVMAQESVPAVLETAMEASDLPVPRSNGSVALSSEFENGIDALSISAAARLTSSTVAVVEGFVDVTRSQARDSSLTTLTQTPQESATSPTQCSSSSVVSVEVLPETKLFAETQSAASLMEPSETPEETKVPAETKRTSQTVIEGTGESKKSESPMETQPRSIPVESMETLQKAKSSTESIQSSSPLIGALKKVQEASESVQSSSSPSELSEKPQEVETSGKSDESCSTAIESVEKAEKTKIPKIPAEPEKSSVLTREPIEQSALPESTTETEKPASCPMKLVKITDELPVKTKKATIQIEPTAEITSQSVTSEDSPTRPARTKDLQIPDTPTITEATPPTSPPIGGAENLEVQQPPQTTKVTRKIVKKIVKKTTNETKPVDATDAPDTDGKRVTKKIVKKVVKKKEEDGNAESTSVSDKPTKKIVKVVKKTTKTSSQTLDAEATVPETPPPIAAPEIPVPPKRKLKTTVKTTTQKSDSEP